MEREELIRTVTAAQNGDSSALNTLFNAFYNDVYYFALKTVKDDDLACDITQETFVEIINTLGNLEEPVAFVTWMKKITYHQCTRYFKKKKDVLVDEDEDGNTIFDTLTEERTEFIPDEALDQEDFRKTIMGMIDALSEGQRAAVMMFYYDELSIKQIAEIQGISEGTVKSRLNYARKAIKGSVEEYEKKNNIKLHSFGFLPLLLWLFRDRFSKPMPTASAQRVAAGVSGATGVAISVSAGTATAAVVTTTATATGIVAKIASIPIFVKIAAGIAAVAILIGGYLAITRLAMSDDTLDAGDTQSLEAPLIAEQTEYTEATDPVAEPAETTPAETTPTTTESEETNPAETTPSTTETGETTPTHAHSYTSEVTKAATCTEKGVTTFTCSCGNSYTEEINATGHSHTVTDSKQATCTEDGFSKYACACGDTYTTTETAKGHSMSGWEIYTASSNSAPGEKRNSCANCDYYESEMQYNQMFCHYGDIALGLPSFTSVQELQNELGSVVSEAIYANAVNTDTTVNDGIYTMTLAVSEMHAFTSRYLGTTFDYTGMNGEYVLYASKCSYDASNDSLIITGSYGMGDGGYSYISQVAYTTEDDSHFFVDMTISGEYPDGQPYTAYCSMTVELVSGQYIITSIS